MAFVLDERTAPAWARARDLAPAGPVEVETLEGGVSATVVALRYPGGGIVVKQALARLRVDDDWRATQERTATEAAAMRLCATLAPGTVPAVLAIDTESHVMAMELVEGCANWQAEIGAGRVRSDVGAWAGETLATWHAATTGRRDVVERFGDLESFEQQRLRPFHETVASRLPELADAIAPRADELRRDRTCLVHGDYAPKNMLVGPSGPWVLDFEVAHHGNPLFDLAFFLSFVVLSALRWPGLEPDLRKLGEQFLDGYGRAGREVEQHDLVAHTGCLILARTDGKSPALFHDAASRARSRDHGRAILLDPGRGLWPHHEPA